MDIRKFFSKAPASGGAKGGGGAKPAAPSSAKAKSPDKSKAKKPAKAEDQTPRKGSRKRSQAEDEVANGGGDEEEEVVEVPAKKKPAVAKAKEGGEGNGAVAMDEDDGEVVEVVESPQAVAATTSRSTTDSKKKRTPTTRSSSGKKRAAAAKPKPKPQKGKKRRKTSLVSSDEESESEEEEEEDDDDEDFEAAVSSNEESESEEEEEDDDEDFEAEEEWAQIEPKKQEEHADDHDEEEEEQEEEESSDDEEDEQPKRRRGAAAKPKPKPSPVKKEPPTPAKKKEPTPKKAKTPVKKEAEKKKGVEKKDDDDEDEYNDVEEVEEVVPVKKDEPKAGGLKLTALSKAAEKAAKPGGSETKRKLPSTLTGQAPPRQETSVSAYFNMTDASPPASGDGTAARDASKKEGSAGPSPAKANKDAPAAVKKDSAAAMHEDLFEDDDDDDVQVVKEEKPAVKPEAAKQEVKSPAPAAVKSPEKGGRPQWRGLERSGPLKPGAREVPEGSPECLDGLTFVVTGVMETLGREEIDDYIKRHGGRVTGSVSGKTSYLVRGIKLEDERPVEQGKKYQNAVEKKVKILTEAELFDMVSSGGPKPSDRPAGKKSTPKKKPAPPPYRPGAPSSSSSSGKGRASDASSLQPVIPSEGMLSGENDLWADKYKPRSIQELVGGQDTANKLKNWLNNWDAVHRTKTKPAPGFNKENPGAKAVLLSGPPGIGKSTTAGLVARLEGFTVLELNASDTRSKRTLEDELRTVLDNTALPTSNDVAGRAQHKRAVIMDEVDGMSGSDRGGIQELIKLIKLSKVPIICICNDRQHQKIRSLVNHCYDLRVKRPQRPQIAARMMDIAKREGLTVERNAIEIVIESVGNDIRQVLNTMQMWQKTSSRMGYADVKNRMSSIDKDSQHRISAFDAGKMILCESRSKPFFDRYNAFFIDYSLLPLLIQHNYVDCIKNVKNESLVQRLDRLEAASATLSDADLVSRMIMGGDQHWELLPLQAALNVKVGYHTTGMIPFPQFPAWLGKNSAKGKRRRLVQEMTMHMAGRISGGPQAVRLSYLPALKQRIIGLLQGGADNVDEVIELLDEYGLSREDVMESMTEFGFDQQGQGKDVKDPLKELDSKVKAALTREYNKTVHKSQGINYSLYQVKKGRKGAAAAGGGGGDAGGSGAGAVDEEGAPLETEAGEALGEENAEEEASVGEEEDLSIFKKKGRGGGGKGGGAAAAGSSSSGGGGSGKGRRGGGAASGKGKGRAKK